LVKASDEEDEPARCEQTGRLVGVLGGGAWGTALAQTARHSGHHVKLWAYEPETAAEINVRHTNEAFLPGIELDAGIAATSDAGDLADADILLIVTPSRFLGTVTGQIAATFPAGKTAVICAKGFEEGTGRLMSEVARAALPDTPLAVLSGPSFAADVARGLPVALTLACEDEALGAELTRALAHRAFRLYSTDDVVGAQIGGAVKNVLAIAAGIVAGRDFGASARAALTTRGFAELVRFGMKLGARFETLTGLSGLGDLILTCSDMKSRNMSLGFALGQGKTLAEIEGARKSVAEGVHSAGAVVTLAREHGVEMPICEAVHGVLSARASVGEAIEAVLARPFRAEVMRASELTPPASNNP
jgi:glycerol-3-phosphate dehydrogenase (NAD(P)+)